MLLWLPSFSTCISESSNHSNFQPAGKRLWQRNAYLFSLRTISDVPLYICPSNPVGRIQSDWEMPWLHLQLERVVLREEQKMDIKIISESHFLTHWWEFYCLLHFMYYLQVRYFSSDLFIMLGRILDSFIKTIFCYCFLLQYSWPIILYWFLSVQHSDSTFIHISKSLP